MGGQILSQGLKGFCAAAFARSKEPVNHTTSTSRLFGCAPFAGLEASVRAPDRLDLQLEPHTALDHCG